MSHASDRAVIGWKPRKLSMKAGGVRLRCLLPLNILRKAGLPVEIYDPNRAAAYKVVVIHQLYAEKELAIVRAAKERGQKVVYDICSNQFYRENPGPEFEAEVKQLREMLSLADTVTVANEELGRQMPRPTEIVHDAIADPGMLGVLHGTALSLFPRAKEFRLVWFGVHRSHEATSGMRDILHIAPVLEALHKEHPICLTVISNSRETYAEVAKPLPFPTRYVEWKSYDQFCAVFRQHDVCVLPINKNPFTLCKSNDRLATSLLLGVPVVAEAIPTYLEFERFAMLNDFAGGLRKYLREPALGKLHAAGGGLYVRSKFMVEQSAAKWWCVFEKLL